MRTTRFYVADRRAWTPRLWPMLIVGAVVSVVTSLLLQPTAIEAIVLGIAISSWIGFGRWQIWKHRHPIVPLDEYITDLINDIRRTARWN